MPLTPAEKRKRRLEKKAWAIAYLGGCCIQCGSTKNLEFHHRDPKTKIHNVSHYWDLDELKKCELRCVPCHDKIHETKHGTAQRYTIHGCRCDICLEGKRLRNLARPSRAKKNEDLIRHPAKHGTRSKYEGGCRCMECKEANRQHGKAMRAKRST